MTMAYITTWRSDLNATQQFYEWLDVESEISQAALNKVAPRLGLFAQEWKILDCSCPLEYIYVITCGRGDDVLTIQVMLSS